MPQNSYDALPYTCYPRQDTHPWHLASIATLFGMSPPPVATCRMLEIGCADGTHLAAIALGLPEGRFLGLDAAARQIADGRQRLAPLGLDNLELRQADIMELGAELGRFDYIVAHGVYSWVPEAVQERLLAVCRACLAPGGIAYISYNTRPGWNMRTSIRDMLLFHTRHFPDMPAKLKQLKAWLRYARDYAQDRDTPYDRYLREESAAFLELDDDYLFHEFLEEHNRPLYFHEFIARAMRHGLRYVGDSQLAGMFKEQYSPLLSKTLGQLDMIHKEQYLDFLDNRQFRQSLLTHRETGADPALGLRPEVLYRFYFASPLQADPGPPDFAPGRAMRFGKPRKAEIVETDPLLKAALYALSQAWPASLGFDELHRRVGALLAEHAPAGADAETARRHLAAGLLGYYLREAIEAALAPPRLTTRISDCPTASPLARLMAEENRDAVFNLRFEPVWLSPILRRLLCLLDGRTRRADLLEAIWGERAHIDPPLDAAGRPLAVSKEVLSDSLDGILRSLAANALLIA